MNESEVARALVEERFGKSPNWTSEWVTRYVRSQERIADLLEELVGKMRR
jgi:hypothetical protein